MLFDLTGRGRRRTVRVIYSGLALLFLLGFVGFGVGSLGGGGGGGLFEAVFGGKGEGGGNNYSSQVAAAKKLTVKQPNNPAVWSGLIHATLLQAGSESEGNYNGNENVFLSQAQPLLRQVHEAWLHYLKLQPQHPSSELAAEVLRIYITPGGLHEPKEAVKALKIEISGRPSSAPLYYDLAVLSYEAGDKAEGDRASQKALALAPASERAVMKSYLAKVKNPTANTATGSKGGNVVITTKSGQTVTVPSSDLKSSSNGKSVTIPSSALKGAGKASTSASATATAPAGGTTKK